MTGAERLEDRSVPIHKPFEAKPKVLAQAIAWGSERE
jgi:hypothetical protein